MAGMSFDYEPNLATGRELQRVAGSQGQVDFHVNAAIHNGGNDDVALLERDELARKHVAGAQPDWRSSRQQNVSGANADAQS